MYEPKLEVKAHSVIVSFTYCLPTTPQAECELSYEVFADGTVLLFDYADRDPLTNNAHVTDVTKDVFENLNRD